MQYKYIIVEDNKGAVNNLLGALKKHKNLSNVGIAHNAKKGEFLARTQKPHIVFLDVELGDENGFDVLKSIRQFTDKFPVFIMITGHDRYAKSAVNSDVLYFLDKPVDPDELTIAIQKAKEKILNHKIQISIKNTEGHYFISLSSIIYIKAENNCVMLFLKDSPPMLVTKTLKAMDLSLPPYFIRIHKSYIINSHYVKMLNTTNKILQIEAEQESYEFPIGNTYLEKVRKSLLQNI